VRTNTSVNNSNLFCNLVILTQPAVNYYPKSTLFGTLGMIISTFSDFSDLFQNKYLSHYLIICFLHLFYITRRHMLPSTIHSHIYTYMQKLCRKVMESPIKHLYSTLYWSCLSGITTLPLISINYGQF